MYSTSWRSACALPTLKQLSSNMRYTQPIGVFMTPAARPRLVYDPSTVIRQMLLSLFVREQRILRPRSFQKPPNTDASRPPGITALRRIDHDTETSIFLLEEYQTPPRVILFWDMGPLHSAHPFALTHDPKPTIVVVPDAWLPAAAYARCITYLEDREYLVEIINHPSLAVGLPSLNAAGNATVTTASMGADAASLRRNLLERLIEGDGCDVVLLVHGYGMKPGLSAARSLHKATRFRNDFPGGVLGIIGVASVVSRENLGLEARISVLPSWVRRDTVSMHSMLRSAYPVTDHVQRSQPRPGLYIPENPQQRFAGDCDTAAAQDHISQMRPMAVGALESLQTPTALQEDDYEGCLGAVVATHDQAYSQVQQEQSLTSSGRRWMIHRMECSHSAPFIEKCAELVDVVERMIDTFEQRLDERWVAESSAS